MCDSVTLCILPPDGGQGHLMKPLSCGLLVFKPFVYYVVGEQADVETREDCEHQKELIRQRFDSCAAMLAESYDR